MSDVELIPEVREFLAQKHSHFIGGSRRQSGTADLIEVVNPANGEVIARVPEANTDDVDAAVEAAQRGFRAWRNVAPARRETILRQFADLIEADREIIAQIETSQSGKTIRLSRLFEVDQAVAFLRYYAGWAQRINGQTMQPSLPSMAGERYTAFTRREPLGVVVGIIPWNFSVMIAVWKLASALVTGNSIIVKPSEYTPLTMLKVAELAAEAGLPDGALNVITGRGALGQALIEHDGTAKVSFTGSVPTGEKVGAVAMQSKITRTTLELGGKNPVGFLPDVDGDKAADGIIEAGFLHSGQICAAAENFFVHRSRLDEIVDKLGRRLDALKIGPPMDEATDFGPVSNKAHLDKLSGFFQQAISRGSKIAHGGRVLDRPGYYVEPTALIADSIDDPLANEETFGPIATFLPYDDEEELIAYMNHGPYGLAASLWTDDLSTAMRLIPEVQAGTVWVNMHTILDPAVPFGGMKASGTGREFGDAFIDDFTELKSVMIRY